MRTTDSKPGRSVNPLDTERPIGLFSSLKMELSVLITISTIIAFIMAWFLLKVGLSLWIAMPITLAVALGITYFFSRGLTSPLREMRDAAEAMADGDYTVRVHVDANSRDEVGQLALSFNEMAEELQHADQMRRDMVANVSHELRTPVSALQAMVENMADGVVEPTPSNLESILNQTHRLSDLIAFLLDLSRMEAGAASLQIDKFNFADFIDETVEPLEIADAGHAHDIEMHVPDDIEMAGDQDRLRQLFTNIIANALKHSADGTTVLVDAHEDENQGTIVTNVVNFGSQIAPSDRLDIFRRFVKGKTGPGTESGGTGLGLSIARWAPSKWSPTREVPISKSSCLNITSPNADIVRRPTVYCIRTDVRIQGGRRSMTQQSESQAMAHEATLFVMQMAGDSMINAGIHNGDLLIVDRSLAPVPGDVVAAVMDDEIAIKRLVSRAGITILHAENPRYPDYMPSNGASPAIWGIVTDVIHPLISSSDRRTTASANTSTPTTLVPAC